MHTSPHLLCMLPDSLPLLPHAFPPAGMSEHPDFTNIRTLGAQSLDPSSEPGRWTRYTTTLEETQVGGHGGWRWPHVAQETRRLCEVCMPHWGCLVACGSMGRERNGVTQCCLPCMPRPHMLLRPCRVAFCALCPLQTRSEWVDIDLELESLLNGSYAQVKAILERNRCACMRVVRCATADAGMYEVAARVWVCMRARGCYSWWLRHRRGSHHQPTTSSLVHTSQEVPGEAG